VDSWLTRRPRLLVYRSTGPATATGALVLRGLVWRSAHGVGESGGEVSDACDQFGWFVDLEAETECCYVDGDFVEGVGSGVQEAGLGVDGFDDANGRWDTFGGGFGCRV